MKLKSVSVRGEEGAQNYSCAGSRVSLSFHRGCAAL